MSKGPLAGIRVADFTWIGAGSFTTKMLADFGADVIKVESSTRPDTLRMTAPFKDGRKGPNRSGYFADRNTSKRSICLNLKHPDALAIADRLIAQSDIVANNFSPGTMEKFGLGYERVARNNPGIVYLSMSMQGQDGPDSRYVGFGLTIGALSGLHSLSGPADRPPAGTSTNYPDHVPNPTHAAFAVLAALRHKRRTGQGQFIDFAQTEPAIALIGTAIAEWSANGHLTERQGNDDPRAAPHGVYPCQGTDRWIAIGVHDDAQWRALLAVLGNGTEHESWTRADARMAQRRELDAWLARMTTGWVAEELMLRLQQAGVPAGVVQRVNDLIDSDPQLAHRGHWVYLDHPEMGRTLYNGPPIQLSATPVHLRRAAPLLGQHTHEVCTDLLGLGEGEFAALQAAGVFQ